MLNLKDPAKRAELDAAFAMPPLECAVAFARRRERLSMNAPVCRKCGDEQVQLFDWLKSPALWKCRRCGNFWPDERASNVELTGAAPKEQQPKTKEIEK